MGLGSALKGAREKASEVGDKAVEMGGVAADKVNQLIDEYTRATERMEGFGFQVTRFHVGMGVLPEINASIYGSLRNIDEGEIQRMIDESGDQKLLVGMLKALLTAKELQVRAKLEQFGAVALEVKLGLPPKIDFDLQPEVS